MSAAWVLIVSFFLLRLATGFITLGATVSAALDFGGIAGTSMIVLIQALGALIALGCAQMKVFKARSLNVALVVLGLVMSVSIAFINPETMVWKICFLVRNFAGTWLFARILTLVPIIAGDNKITLNKRVQIGGMAAIMTGFIVGPVVATALGFRGILLIDGGFSLFLLLGVLGLRKAEAQSCAKGMLEARTRFEWPSLPSLKTLVGTFLVFIVAGIFNVIEVPYLMDQFQASSYQISLFYSVGLGAMFIAMGIVRVDWIKRGSAVIFLMACILCFATHAVFLLIPQFGWLFVLNFFIGASIGLINLAQTSIFQEEKGETQRTNAFILRQLFMQFGLLTSVFIAKANTYATLKPLFIWLFVGATIILSGIFYTPQLWSRARRVEDQG